MPSTTFTDSAVALGGPYVFSNVAGHTAAQGSLNSVLDARVTGTDATLYCFVGGQTATVSVDGGAPVTLPQVSNWVQVSLFSGLTDTTHTIHVVCPGVYLDRPGLLTVTGAAPACTAPTGQGAQIAVTDNSSSFTLQAGAALANQSGVMCVRSSYYNSTTSFRATTTTVAGWMWQDGQKYLLQVDRVDNVTITTPNTLTWGWVVFSTTLDGTAPHIYTIEGVGLSYYLYSIYLSTGGTLGSAPALLPLWAFYGDSITAGHAGTGSNNALAFPHKLGQNNTVATANLGVSGAKLVGTSYPAGEAASRVADVTQFASSLINLVILYGTNDIISGTTNPTQFQTSYTNMLTQLLAVGTYHIYCLSMLTTPGFNTSSYDAAIAAAVAAVANSRATYHAAGSWINGTTDLYDGLHPNPTGYTKITNALQPIVVPVPPSTPTGLAAPTTVQVAVSWTAMTGATGYKLYKNGSLLYDGTATSYSDSVAVGAAASYTVLAYNSAGSSAQSSAVVATTGGAGLLITMQGGFNA